MLIVPFSDRVLRYYTGEDISLKMLSILQKGQLDDIFVLGPSEMPPYKIPDIGVKGDTPLLKNHTFNVIQSFGNLRLYKLTFSIKKLFPFDGDRDYENHLNLKHDKTTQIDHVKQPKIAGNESLLVRQYANHGKLMSRQFKMIKIITMEVISWSILLQAIDIARNLNFYSLRKNLLREITIGTV